MFDFRAHRKDIEMLCRKYGVKRLEFFGSAVTEEFDANSDIDCLIEFEKDGGNYFHRFFDLKYALEELFGRKVDLVVGSAIRNPYFRASIDRSLQLIYAT